jgi:hypothetical protein
VEACGAKHQTTPPPVLLTLRSFSVTACVSARERERNGRGSRRVDPADVPVQVGGDAAGAAHHPDGVRSPHRLLPRRPRPHPIQRRP